MRRSLFSLRLSGNCPTSVHRPPFSGGIHAVIGDRFKRCSVSRITHKNAGFARSKISAFAVVASLSLASCSTILGHVPGVYTLEIQQGNIVDQAMIDQLRPGMNKRQVLYIMGSPMLVDVFHQKRWDYIYSDQPSGEDRKQKRITLFFENDQIVGIQGDFRPGAAPVIKRLPETTVDVPKRNLEKTMWEKITGFWGFSGDNEPKTDKAAQNPSENNLPF